MNAMITAAATCACAHNAREYHGVHAGNNNNNNSPMQLTSIDDDGSSRKRQQLNLFEMFGQSQPICEIFQNLPKKHEGSMD